MRQVLILINTFRSLSFEKIRLALLIEFGTNTLASLTYFAIPVVANHMRSFGAQTADGNELLILINSLRLLSFKKDWARFARIVWYKYTRFAHVFCHFGRSQSYEAFRCADGGR